MPIGPPIANTQFLVLDRNGQLVPIGVPGELWIGGQGVARGYWNDPRQTAEKFVTTPISKDPHSRFYRTGDLVRYLPDGNLEFLGRADTQVKVRGFRIETAEVESVLRQYPGVRECVVNAREVVAGDKRLVAYLVGTKPSPPPAELRRFIAARLPDYMVPSLFVELDSLPLTPNGKVNRKGLPAPGQKHGERNGSFTAPRNPTEALITKICSEVLKLDRIDVEESLFDLGADSIHLFQIAARAEDGGVKITPTQILSGRTIAAICLEIKNGENGKTPGDEPDLAPVSRQKHRIQRSWLS